MELKREKKNLLKKAVVRIMAPLVRLMIAQGLTHREFCDDMKRVYYDTAFHMLQSKKEPATASQISVLTGLHRKDIAVFRDEKDGDIYKNERPYSPCAAIVAEWISNPKYTLKNGTPMVLPYSADKGSSFSRLVESVSQDVRPKAFLQEMKRLELVTVLGGDPQKISLQKSAFLPSKDFKEKINFLTKNIGDHMAAAVSNLEGNAKPFFERSAFHESLSEEDITALQAFLEADGMTLLKNIYQKAEGFSQRNQKTQDGIRMTCGLYFFADKEVKE